MVPHNISRRGLLKGVAGTGLTLTFAGIASANEQTQYIVRAKQNRAADRIEQAGYTIKNELADGRILLVTGPDNSQDELENIRGVQIAIPDFEIQLEDPIGQQEAGTTQDQPDLWDLQWDKHITDVKEAHDIATGDGTTIAILDTGIDHTHPDLQNVKSTKATPSMVANFTITLETQGTTEHMSPVSQPELVKKGLLEQHPTPNSSPFGSSQPRKRTSPISGATCCSQSSTQQTKEPMLRT